MPPKKKGVTKKKADKQNTKNQNKSQSKSKSKSKSKSPTPTKQKGKGDSKRGRKNSDKSRSPSPKKQTQKSPEKKEVKQIVKGNAAVDKYVPQGDSKHILQSGGKIYASTLNQTNLGGNNNKFYIVQICQSDSNSSQNWLFTRWGRVGVQGQQAFEGPMDEKTAISKYEKKYKAKTSGGYSEIFINYGGEEDEEEEEDKNEDSKEQKKEESKLHKQTQELINMIFDTNLMDEAMKQIGYDSKKMPLGKLADESIKVGYEVLKELSQAIKENKGKQVYQQLTSKFYTHIPHDFGFQNMMNFILDNEEKVKEKLNTLSSLSDMKLTTSILKQKDKANTDNIIDQNYKKLKCDLEVLDKNKDEDQWKLIENFVNNTKENWSVDIKSIWKVNREGEEDRYDKSIGNDRLLWHGSRVTNYGGILSQGLRIAPPEAPVSGYLYGKGVYFADQFSKSAHYCRGVGTDILIMLCDVAVGNPKVYERPNCYAADLPQGCDSTKGYGTMAPPENSYVQMPGTNVKIPQGKPQRTTSSNYQGHNEYIVYRLDQVRIRYLLRIGLDR